MWCVAAAVLLNVGVGGHVVSVRDPYSWTKGLFSKLLPQLGVETTFVDGGDPREFAGAIRENTELIYLESPNSFTFELQHLGAVSSIARERGVLAMLAYRYSTPLCQLPLVLGIVISFISATQYLG